MRTIFVCSVRPAVFAEITVYTVVSCKTGFSIKKDHIYIYGGISSFTNSTPFTSSHASDTLPRPHLGEPPAAPRCHNQGHAPAPRENEKLSNTCGRMEPRVIPGAALPRGSSWGEWKIFLPVWQVCGGRDCAAPRLYREGRTDWLLHDCTGRRGEGLTDWRDSWKNSFGPSLTTH